MDEVNACISPLKCKLISSPGSTVTFPPPVAPPLTPKTGPKDGSRKHNITDLPILFNPSVKAQDIVVFPSPALVGVIAVTKTNLPSFLSFNSSMIDKSTFALYFPYGSMYFSSIPALRAIL